MEIKEFDNLVSGLSTQDLLLELRALGVEKWEIMPADVSPSNQRLLAKLLSEEGVVADEPAIKAAIIALGDWQALRRRNVEIRTKIAEAERLNDATTLLRLQQEKLELDRRLAASQG